MDIGILEDLGLSSAEVKIYLALLELGETKTGKLIDKTKLQSSTVYHILGSLLEKGIISYILKGKIKFYHAEPPQTLLSFVDDKKKKLIEILPELKKKEQSSKQKQNAKIYEGIKGFTAAFNDLLETMNKGEEYYFFNFGYDKYQEDKIQLFLRNFHLKRSEKGIMVKGISTPKNRPIMKKTYDLPYTQIKYLEEPTPTSVVIYKNKVMTLTWNDYPIAITITSESVYNSYKKFFKHKWKKAKI